MKPFAVLLTLLMTTTAFGQTAQEALESIKQKRAELATSKVEKTQSFADPDQNLRAFMKSIWDEMATEEKLKSEISSLSLALYKDVIKNGSDSEAEELIKRSRYQGVTLPRFFDTLKKTTGAELLEMMQIVLQKPLLRAYLSATLPEEAMVEVGRSFVRAGYSKASFQQFFEKWNEVSKQTETWKANEYYDAAIRQILIGMLSEARKMGTETQVVSAVSANFESGTIKVKQGLLSALALSQSKTAYFFIRKHFTSKTPEIRASALKVWYMPQLIEATDDMIRLVKDVEAGKVTFDQEISSAIYNRVLGDLERVSRAGKNHTNADKLAVLKMRRLVFETLNSPHAGLKANFQGFLKSSAFSTAEIDSRILEIATDPRISNRWTATYLVGWRRDLVTENAANAMRLLLNDTDPVVAQAAAKHLARIESSTPNDGGPKSCKSVANGE